MVQGPQDLPNLIKSVAPTGPAPVRPAAPSPVTSQAQFIQAPDTVQLSAQAVSASAQARSSAPAPAPPAVVPAAIQSEPEVRPARVAAAQASLSTLSGNASALNARLAEKLLTGS